VRERERERESRENEEGGGRWGLNPTAAMQFAFSVFVGFIERSNKQSIK